MNHYNLHTALQRPQSVRKLFLNHQQLTEWPQEIMQLQQLEVLDVSHNQLVEVPEWLGELPRLQRLVVSHNPIRLLPATIQYWSSLEQLEVDHAVLRELPVLPSSLRSLSLKYNHLRELPEHLGELGGLQMLWLSHNEVTKLPNTLVRCKALVGLHVDHNRIQRLPKKIGQLAQLEVLHVEHNRLAKLPEAIGQLEALRQLNVSYNRLKRIPPTISKCRPLRQLYAAHNKLEYLPPSIVQLNWLAKLDVSHNQLTRLPDAIIQLRQLFRLACQHNELKQLPPLPSKLAHIQLQRNQFREFPSALLQAHWLRSINLSGNPIPRIPPGTSRLQRLESLQMQGCNIQQFQPQLLLLDQLTKLTGATPGKSKSRFRPFMNACRKRKIADNDRLTLYAWLAGPSAAPVPTKLLFELLHFRLPEAQLKARKALFANQRNTPASLKTGAVITLLGKTYLEWASTKTLLSTHGIELNKQFSKRTTHLLIGRLPPFLPEIASHSYPKWSEQQFIQWLDQLPERHLAKAQPNQLAHLRKLLLHEEAKHQLLALQLLRGGGVPHALLTDIYLAQATSSHAVLKKGLRHLLALYLDDATWQVLQQPIQFSWQPMNRKRMQGYLKRLCKSGVLDYQKIVRFLEQKI
ncbi:MAG: hypothetical protein AAF798_14460 [Bacteroidota bacterium]